MAYKCILLDRVISTKTGQLTIGCAIYNGTSFVKTIVIGDGSFISAAETAIGAYISDTYSYDMQQTDFIYD